MQVCFLLSNKPKDYNKPFWQGGLRYVVVGWIPDRRIVRVVGCKQANRTATHQPPHLPLLQDLSDPQYFSWRSSIFSVVLLFGTFVVASRWIRSKCSSSLRVMRLVRSRTTVANVTRMFYTYLQSMCFYSLVVGALCSGTQRVDLWSCLCFTESTAFCGFPCFVCWVLQCPVYSAAHE
jgi:hypothetical protein